MSSTAAVTDYLVRVRTALADLPSAEVEEIIEDVRPHLAQIGEELGEDARIEALTERLGAPEDYAAELRAAGGYPAPVAEQATAPGKGPSRLGPRLAVWSLVLTAVVLAFTGYVAGLNQISEPFAVLLVAGPVLALGAWYVVQRGQGSVTGLPEVRSLRSTLPEEGGSTPGQVRDYLRSLKPAWWLLCALVLVTMGLLVARKDGQWLLLPLLAAIGLVALWAGPRSRTDRRWLWYSVPVSALVAGGVFGLAGAFADEMLVPHSPDSMSPYGYPAQTADGSPALQYGHQQLENVYVFDAEGKPLTDVYLYDETGRPISLPRYACEPGTGSQTQVGTDNRFPRPKIEFGAYDDQGRYNGYNAYQPICRESDEVPFTAAIPKAPGK